MAGGLLVYTWGVKCMSPIQEAFEKASSETFDSTTPRYIVPLIGLGVTVVFAFGSLFFIATSGEEIHNGIFMQGVRTKESAPVCTDSGHLDIASTNVTAGAHIRARPVRPHQAGANCAPESINLLPYFMGFALDAIMLVLVDPEEELLETFQAIKRDYVSCLKDLLVAPIAFSLDNFLSGAGVASMVLAKMDGSKGGAVGIFFLFALSCPIGVPIACAVRGIEEILYRKDFKALSLWLKFAFLLWVALSFLDNGLSLCSDGMTYWVGLGGCFGWMLFMMEICMADEEPKESS